MVSQTQLRSLGEKLMSVDAHIVPVRLKVNYERGAEVRLKGKLIRFPEDL